MKPTPVRSLSESYAARAIKRIRKNSHLSPTGCHVWHASLDRHGYGKFKISDGPTQKMTGAHRAAWLAIKGPIHGDLMIDHLCRTRNCVNVEHMELVTNAVNTLRADHSNKAGRSGVRTRRGCQRHGHDDGFERMQKNGYPVWHCRPCAKRRAVEWKLRQEAANS